MSIDDKPIRLGPYGAGDVIELDSPPGAPRQVHVLSEPEILAVLTAMAAGRALLVRGEPGTGKSQLAKAAAAALRRPFVPFAVDSRAEARDLLWRFDAVARLAEAQLRGATRQTPQDAATSVAADGDPLDVRRFIKPGPLWWAFDWESAVDQARLSNGALHECASGADSANGVVVLIDEIDKAEAEVPNGLLEVLGAASFTPDGFDHPIAPIRGPLPLIIITTNEERTLPDAFLRRCLVLRLELPEDFDALVTHLMRAGEAHFPAADEALLREAAEMLANDRATARRNNWRPFPGQAEYLDLVRAVLELAGNDETARADWLRRCARFALHKNPAAASEASVA